MRGSYVQYMLCAFHVSLFPISNHHPLPAGQEQWLRPEETGKRTVAAINLELWPPPEETEERADLDHLTGQEQSLPLEETEERAVDPKAPRLGRPDHHAKRPKVS